VDVGTGNLLVTTNDLSVLGVGGELGLGLAYNSAAMAAPSLQATAGNPTGYGWTQTVGFGVRVQPDPDGSVVLWGPSGSAGTFTPGAVAGTFIPPAGVTADLATTAGGGWKLTDHASAQKLVFNAAGVLVTVADRNENPTTIGYAASAPTRPTSFTGSAGPGDARIITAAYAETRMTGLSQAVAGGLSRAVGYEYSAAGDLVVVRDPSGAVTNLGYTTDHLPASVSSPGSVVTQFTYDSAKRVVGVRQVNTSPGSPGDSWTRLAYPSLSEVRVSDGAQEQALSPNTAQRTTYTLTADRTGRVALAVDAAGRTRAAKYTPNQDIEIATQGAGVGASITTNTFGANAGESLTGQQNPSGATRGWDYANTDPATKYLPSSSTDSAGNKVSTPGEN